MDTLRAMEAFSQVAANGSFSGAAENLGLSRAVVTKYVAQLESHLGVRLLNRTTRRVSLTEVGQDYVDFCGRMLAELRDKEALIAAGQSAAEGTVKVLAPKSFGGLYLGSAVAAFQRRHPRIGISMFLTDVSLRSVDLVAHGYDLAIRLTDLADSSLMARRIGTVHWQLCAAPAYISEAREPQSPDDLAGHRCLLHTRNPSLPTSAVWKFQRAGLTFETKVSGTLAMNSVMALRQATLAGAGLAMLPDYCIGEDLKSGALVNVMGGYTRAEEQISVLFPHRELLPMKSRLFIDFLAEAFQIPPWERA
jgi:DNA-binding transcriptional LysR family regulator